MKRLLKPSLLATCLVLATGGSLVRAVDGDGPVKSDKGDFRYATAGAWPEMTLDLDPIQREVGRAAASRCGTGLAAAPLDFGKAPGFLGKMAGNLASAAASKLIGSLFGGGGGGSKDDGPPLKKDPIRKGDKERFEDLDTGTRIRVGSRAYSDALLISADIEKSKGKGTFHTIFLEKSDCTRIFPEDTWGYKRWGKWSLSVSITKTTRTYQNGNLVNESVSKSGWSKSGTFDPARMVSIFGFDEDAQAMQLMLDPNVAFLNQLKNDLDTPLWQQMGYGEPTQGVRSVGAAFPGLTAADLGDDTVAIVHVTRVDKGRYHTVGFPLKMHVSASGDISLEQLPVDF